jgi:hypothetical protein
LFFAALLATQAPDSWPRGLESQIWIVISFWIFFYLIFDILWVVIFPLSSLSLLSPVWNVIKEFIRHNWKYGFGVDASDGLVIGTFVFMLVLMSSITIVLFYFKHLNRIYYSIIFVFIFMMSLKTLVNSVPAGEICCDFANGENMDMCPILFNTGYFVATVILATMGVAATMYKYKMFGCHSTQIETKEKQDITKSSSESEHKVKSCDLYNRIDTNDSDESQKLLPVTVSTP